jgi:putative integral membrane protein (TIGR02587 family)
VSTATPFFSDGNREYAICVVRAFGGALLFSLPILMTMEMWQLGVAVDRLRLALLLIVMLPLLAALAYYLGFEDATEWHDAVLDAFVAIAVAAVLALAILSVFGAIERGTTLSEGIGMVALQTVTGSIGALLAQSQFGRAARDEQQLREAGDFGEYFTMAAGALFLSANVAPTEEVVLIAHMMSPWHALVLAAISLTLMHAFVYAVGFRGQHQRAADSSLLREFLRFTVVGYLLALGISAYICWTFGRFDGVEVGEALHMSIALGFPASIGAAAARLVL